MDPIGYIKDTKAELRHVSWPTREQVARFTVLVVILSLLVAALLGAFDFVFNAILEQFVVGTSTPSAGTELTSTTTPQATGTQPAELDLDASDIEISTTTESNE